MPADPTNAKPNDPLPGVEAWMNSPQFRDLMRDEFPEDAAEWLDPVSRRAFLSLSAAGIALATGCNPSFKPASQRKVVPYVKQPEHIRPGVPLFFATAMPQHGGVGLGLIVKQSEGRPLKAEGNPDHPSSLGKINLSALASLLDLYDPDRSAKPTRGDARLPATFDDTVAAVRAALAKFDTKPTADRGEGVRFLTAPTTSPTVQALMERFLARYPKAVWVQYEPVSRDNLRKATKAAFGKPLNPVYDLKAADVVLSLDADFLTQGAGAVRNALEFGGRRTVSTVGTHHDLEHKSGKHPKEEEVLNAAVGNLNRVYVVEAMPSAAGVAADHRLPLKPSELESFARALAAELKVEGVTAPGDLPDLAKKWLKPLAADLLKNKGKAVVIAGEQTSPATQLLALAINKAIDAIGKTVKFTDPLEAVKDPTAPGTRNTLAGWPADDHLAAFKQLTDDMKAGKVDCLLMSGVNPLYDAPADLKFGEALEAVRKTASPVLLHHGLYHDETAAKCNWHLNAAHYLESWGDVRGHDGSVSVIQPLIAPLYGGKTLIELLAAVLEETPADSLGQVRKTHEKLDEKTWETGLKKGVFDGTAFKPVVADVKFDAKLLDDAAFSVKPIKDLEIQFRPDPAVFDGQQANNGWLQELPKPITNLCWDNAAMVSPRTADKLKVQHGFTFNTYRSGERGATETDIVELTVNGRKLKAAVHVLPAHADDVVTLHLGYGRTRSGRVASPENDRVGFNAYELRGTDGLTTAKVDVVRTNGRHFLAIAGAHAAMESRRPYRYASKDQFVNDDQFAKVPPVAAAETHALLANLPGTPENLTRLGLKHPHAHDHGHGDHEHEHVHDKRVIPLSLYDPNPIKVTPHLPGAKAEDANKTYRRWAMSIDLGQCIGCGACTLACQAENNIPVVGKEQVHRGRAMHWIRIDRYYTIPTPGKLMSDEYGAFEVPEEERKKQIRRAEDIKIHTQPVPCMHCEKAPCEVVCPVAATVHSADGLNDMVYNRCVGTRYCSNNCPYKVRRFNFLQYADYSTDSLKLLNNPEVTVRTRGVMEKCTYCTQRIRIAEIEAEREWNNPARPKDTNGRPKILDGEVVTACQQACPTGAIKFGDMNDPAAEIMKWKAEPHTYGLLVEQNTMPRTSYLAAIRNPNPDLEAVIHDGKGA
ncbi:MAG: TAT-variant-translocated molybdopterin oxidoreductase [Fimbriiglobus sp.]|jgi:molybdopterin-containing oxidoreductase family iron-sulfur binding subunit|nr:TAT-variant-translocated molybdopterin oxidoreductase [Fimbriiglobus sp.]